MLAFVDARQVNLSVCSAFKRVLAYLGLEKKRALGLKLSGGCVYKFMNHCKFYYFIRVGFFDIAKYSR